MSYLRMSISLLPYKLNRSIIYRYVVCTGQECPEWTRPVLTALCIQEAMSLKENDNNTISSLGLYPCPSDPPLVAGKENNLETANYLNSNKILSYL